jgi:hypothetical protein
MKKIMFASLLSLFVTAFATAQDNDHETIEGNGKRVTKEIPVTSFDALQSKGVYELRLTQGSNESVKIEADENLQQYFDVRNEGNKLVIGMKDTRKQNWRVKNKMIVYVTFKNLKSLDLSMVGNVRAENQLKFTDLSLKNSSVGNADLKLTADKIDVNNSGVGNLVLEGRAQNAIVKNNGVGKLQAGEFVVQSMDIENTGVGSAEVNAEKDLKVKDSFLGKVRNKGNAPVRKNNKVRV